MDTDALTSYQRLGDETKFELSATSKAARPRVEAAFGKSLSFPDLADRVADNLYKERMTIGTAAARRGGVGAFTTGMLLSLVLTSCGTPALAAILSYAALSGSLVFGGLLLFSYGLGNGLPLVVVGAGSGMLARRFATGRWQTWVERGAGAIMLAIGVFLVWNA